MNKKILLVGFAAIGLSSCDSVKHTLGLDHYQADEYSVPTTPPLSMPPDHNLRAPEIQAQPTGYVPVKKKAQETIGAPSSSGSAETEQNLMKKMSSGEQADPSIRETLKAEADSEKNALDKIRDWGKEASANLSGQSQNSAEPSVSKQNPAQTR